MGNIHTVGPDSAMFITGNINWGWGKFSYKLPGGCGQSSRSVVIGDWGWAWWFVSDVQK